MDFSKLKKDYESKASGVPKQYADRELIKAADVVGTFTNDAPVVIVRKPKNTNKDEDGNIVPYHRVINKKGEPVFQDVAYIPVLFEDGDRAVIVTATDETVRVLKVLMEEVEPSLMKGESFDDINRWEEYEAEELIEGVLRFGKVKKEYKNGKTFPVAVLEAVSN